MRATTAISVAGITHRGCDNVPLVAKERRLTPRVLSGESTVITVSMHAERLQGNFGGGWGVVVVASVEGR